MALIDAYIRVERTRYVRGLERWWDRGGERGVREREREREREKEREREREIERESERAARQRQPLDINTREGADGVAISHVTCWDQVHADEHRRR